LGMDGDPGAGESLRELALEKLCTYCVGNVDNRQRGGIGEAYTRSGVYGIRYPSVIDTGKAILTSGEHRRDALLAGVECIRARGAARRSVPAVCTWHCGRDVDYTAP
jgi:hypothetical protein